MLFSKRHYIKIAEVLNKYSWEKCEMINKESISSYVIKVFKEDNPKFDENKFLKAVNLS